MALSKVWDRLRRHSVYSILCCRICCSLSFRHPDRDLRGVKMESKLQRLSIKHDPPKKGQPASKTKSSDTVAESWDLDAASSDSDTDTGGVLAAQKSPVPNAPPPTPASPTSALPSWESQDPARFSTRLRDGESEDRQRPEKSTAVAGRLIAAGLGLKAPRKTEDQKAYDKAVRENETERRNKEREEKRKEWEESEKARAAVWES